VNFVVRVWSNSSDLQSVYWDVLERIKREFDANGISFPYPQMDVNFKRVKRARQSNYAPGGALLGPIKTFFPLISLI
jgi:small-conductance mechanosensitive channel